MLTILEVLENAEFNMSYGTVGVQVAKPQLSNAIALLRKGYDLKDNFNEIVDGYDSIEDVPYCENNE